MQDVVREILAGLIKKYGTSLIDDPRRLEGLLRDLCGEYRKEIFIIVNALKERVAADLISAEENIPSKILYQRLQKRLQDHLAITAEGAAWAVESWAAALGKKLPLMVLYEEKQALPVQEKMEPLKENEDSEVCTGKRVNPESQNDNLVQGKGSKFIVCPSCNYKNTLSQRYCSNCYEKLDSSQILVDDNLEFIICPSCQYKNNKNNRYCGNCSDLIKQNKNFDHEMRFIVCPKCGFENLKSNRYCLSCYRRLAE